MISACVRLTGFGETQLTQTNAKEVGWVLPLSLSSLKLEGSL
jgi:hypothetical protein